MTSIDDPLATLKLIPLVTREPAARRRAIAARMTHRATYGPRDEIPPDGPPGGLRILQRGSRVRVALTPVEKVVSPFDALATHVPGTDLAPTLFGGAILPSAPDASAPLRLHPLGEACTVYTLSAEDLAAIAESPPWRLWFGDLRTLVTRLSVAALLKISPDFARLGRLDRHTVAQHTRWRLVAKGTTLSTAGRPDDTLFVCGYTTRLAVERRHEGQTLALRPQGLGTVFGRRALVAQPRWRQCVGWSAPARETVRVTQRGHVATLDRGAIHTLRRTRPWFAHFADGLVWLDDNLPGLLTTLAKSALLAGVPAPVVYELLQGAAPLLWRVQHHPPSPTDEVAGLLAVVEGNLLRYSNNHARRPAGAPHSIAPLGVLRAGDVSSVESFTGPAPAARHLRPRLPARMAFVGQSRINAVLGLTPRFEANLVAVAQRRAARIQAQKRYEAVPPRLKVILYEALDDGAAWRWRKHLVAAAARSMQSQFKLDGEGEATAIVELGATAGVVPRQDLYWVRVAATGDPIGPLITALKRLPPRIMNVIVLPEAGVDLTLVREVVDRVAFVNTGREVRTAPFAHAAKFTYTALLDDSIGPRMAPSRPFPAATVRMRVDEQGWRGEDDPGLGHGVLARNRERIDRWARALTDRTVGITLGGGGGWGYVHVAVLMHLQGAGVPLDVVSGTSFGSLVGVYYCANPQEGIDQLLRDQALLQTASRASLVTGLFLEKVVNHRLGGVQVATLEVPYLPVCTDLVTASQSTLLWGDVGYAVRASGSLPPLFPTTQTARRTYADGGLTANVPAPSLMTEGANLIISSDSVPPPSPPARGQRAWRSPVASVLRDLNPITRMRDALHGSQTLFNAAGEMAAAVAPIHFDKRTATTLPFVLTNAAQVIETARSDPNFWASLSAAERRWRLLSTARPNPEAP